MGGKVLDTAALLAWPLDALRGCSTPPGCLSEVARLEPDRGTLLDLQTETLGLMVCSPGAEASGMARRAATATGDLPRLSEVDIAVLALSIELDLPLVSDDFALQNVSSSLGGEPISVRTSGIAMIWRWEHRCQGCRKTWSGESPGEVCPICGSAILTKRQR